MSRMSFSNCSGYKDCGPSDSAFSGSVCTSTVMPSAPAATAARAMGLTLARRPVPWLGSTMIGRWLSFFTTGMAERSSVLRVEVSKVRIPRSQRITLVGARGKEVLRGHEQVLDGGGEAALQEHGLAEAAHALEQLEVLHVARADLQHVHVVPHEVHVLGGHDLRHHRHPLRLPGLLEVRAGPPRPRPWKAYGEVRGFHAPPRKSTAPDSRTRAAHSRVCARDSTAQGPAMATIRSPPMRTGCAALPRLMTVSSLRNSREASLYGEVMGMTRATPGRSSTSRTSTPLMPTAPRMVSSSPTISRIV